MPASVPHVEIAALNLERVVCDVEATVAAPVRQDEVVDSNIPLRAAHVSPLLMLGHERAVEARRDSVRPEHLAREFHRNRIRTVPAPELGEQSPGDSFGQSVLHGEQREADVVPAEVAQAAHRFQAAADSDVALFEIVRSEKAELRRDASQIADRARVDRFANGRQTVTVHEHDAVHVLHVVRLARREDFLDVGQRVAARFFAHHMLAGLSGFDDPLLADSSRQRNVNRVDVVSGEECFVTANRIRSRIKRRLSLVFGDVLRRAFFAATGDGDERGIVAIPDGLPVFLRDERRS